MRILRLVLRMTDKGRSAMLFVGRGFPDAPCHNPAAML